MEKYIGQFLTLMAGAAFLTMSLEAMERSIGQHLIPKVGEDWPITKYAQTEKYIELFLTLLVGGSLTLNFADLEH